MSLPTWSLPTGGCIIIDGGKFARPKNNILSKTMYNKTVNSPQNVKSLSVRLGAKILGTSVLWYSSTEFAVLFGTRHSYF